MDDDMYSIYLRGKVYVHLCTVQIGVRLSTWYVRYNSNQCHDHFHSTYRSAPVWEEASRISNSSFAPTCSGRNLSLIGHSSTIVWGRFIVKPKCRPFSVIPVS